MSWAMCIQELTTNNLYLSVFHSIFNLKYDTSAISCGTNIAP